MTTDDHGADAGSTRVRRDDEIVLRRDPHTIELRLAGRVSMEDAARAHALLEKAWSDETGANAASNVDSRAFFVVRTTELHAFAPGVREPLIEIMRMARRRGVEMVIGVAASPVTRMMGSVIALAAGVPSRALDADDDIDAVLADEQAKRLLPHRRRR